MTFTKEKMTFTLPEQLEFDLKEFKMELSVKEGGFLYIDDIVKYDDVEYLSIKDLRALADQLEQFTRDKP